MKHCSKKFVCQNYKGEKYIVIICIFAASISQKEGSSSHLVADESHAMAKSELGLDLNCC